MASVMIPPSSAPDFLAANGWGGAEIRPLAGDASFRRYFRVHDGGRTAVLMDAPPEHEDVGPFLNVAHHLLDRGFCPPKPLAIDREHGLLLLEDFGDERVAPLLQKKPEMERQVYEAAIDILVELGREPAPADIPPYDEAAMEREAALLTEWYAPALGLDVDADGYIEAWRESWRDVLRVVRENPVLVLRDYHADNLMVLKGKNTLGLLDFQDALAGHRAYDLVSLLQDARRDVPPELEQAMLARYAEGAGVEDREAFRAHYEILGTAGVEDREAFRAHYEILGAQRNSKTLGIFTRLWKRDGKSHYLPLQPRVWGYAERNLRHPVLEPVRRWFDLNLPADARAAAWERAAA